MQRLSSPRRPGDRATRCYPFIEAENAGNGNASGNVKRACELLKVSRAAYYAHRAKQVSGPSPREQRDAELTDKIVQIHDTSDRPTARRGSTTSSGPKASGVPASGWPG